MKSGTLRTGHRRFAVALALVGVAMLVFASVAGAQTSPSEYPPPPPSPLAPPEWDEEAPLMPVLADADLDGLVDVRDVIAIRRYVVGLDPFLITQQLTADATGDGLVDVRDVIRIRQFIVDPYATSGVLAQLMWQWENPRHHRLQDPLGQNEG